jgi:hypothetical protein
LDAKYYINAIKDSERKKNLFTRLGINWYYP